MGRLLGPGYHTQVIPLQYPLSLCHLRPWRLFEPDISSTLIASNGSLCILRLSEHTHLQRANPQGASLLF